MPRFLALEWNESEVRVAVAASHGDRVAFEQAFSAELKPPPPEGEASPESVGQQVKAALAGQRIGRIDALVAIGRTDVELRRLSLPAAPDEELPELVRFQAIREFNALEDDWPLDFLPIDEDPNEPRNVLAAAVNRQLVDSLRQTCQAAGLKATRLVLRPCAAASLLRRRRPAAAGQACLLVDLLDDEADLTVMVGQKVVFLRHARLRGDPLVEPAASEALVSEIRRTMAAAQNQLGGQRVDSVVLCGTGAEYEGLAQSLKDQLPTSFESFDPFEGLHLEGGLRRALPDHPGRFAPLLGMLWDELDGTPHAFDFLNPRRPLAPPSQRKRYLMAAGAGVLLVLMFLLYGWFRAGSLEGDIQGLTAQYNDLKNQVERAAKTDKAAKAVDSWLSTRVVWLDQIRWLSEKLPSAEDTMLTTLTLGVTSTERGEMSMDVLVQDTEAMDQLVDGLRDESHSVDSRAMGKAKKEGHYDLGFRASVFFDLEKQP